MKKIITYLVIFLVIVGIGLGTFNLFNKKRNNSSLTHITVAEVAHSVFYAPQYLALALGYFEDEGLDVNVTLSNGADAVMAAVLSGDADIGFCGTEATIYVDDKKGNR